MSYEPYEFSLAKVRKDEAEKEWERTKAEARIAEAKLAVAEAELADAIRRFKD